MKVKRNDGVMKELSASDATYSLREGETNLLQHMLITVVFSWFHLFLYFSCIVKKKRRNIFSVKQVVFEGNYCGAN